MKCVVLSALVAAAVALPNVVHWEQEAPVQLKSYSFRNCLPANQELGYISKLEFGPDPIVFPGPLTVSFTVDIKETLDAPLKADVYLGKKVGSTTIKIPCIGNIGSCHYDDLCALMSTIQQCPDPFVAAGVPCYCPLKKATYNLPTASFQVDAAVFPAGDYHAQANLTYSGKTVGCYEIMATFGYT